MSYLLVCYVFVVFLIHAIYTTKHGTVIFVFLSIFTKSQALSPFEAMNSAHLSMSKGCEALCPEEVEDYGFL